MRVVVATRNLVCWLIKMIHSNCIQKQQYWFSFSPADTFLKTLKTLLTFCQFVIERRHKNWHFLSIASSFIYECGGERKKNQNAELFQKFTTKLVSLTKREPFQCANRLLSFFKQLNNRFIRIHKYFLFALIWLTFLSECWAWKDWD
jgi:hypothetical protein